MRKSYGFSPAQTQAIGDSKIYYDPQVSGNFKIFVSDIVLFFINLIIKFWLKKIFNLYMDAKEIYCNADKLKQFLAVNNSNYLELNYSNIDNFWQLSSNFVCYLNVSSLSDLGANITSYFTLPDKVQEVSSPTHLAIPFRSIKFSNVRFGDFRFSSMTRPYCKSSLEIAPYLPTWIFQQRKYWTQTPSTSSRTCLTYSPVPIRTSLSSVGLVLNYKKKQTSSHLPNFKSLLKCLIYFII